VLIQKSYLKYIKKKKKDNIMCSYK